MAGGRRSLLNAGLLPPVTSRPAACNASTGRWLWLPAEFAA
jgi:hypothetical protein